MNVKKLKQLMDKDKTTSDTTTYGCEYDESKFGGTPPKDK